MQWTWASKGPEESVAWRSLQKQRCPGNTTNIATEKCVPAYLPLVLRSFPFVSFMSNWRTICLPAIFLVHNSSRKSHIHVVYVNQSELILVPSVQCLFYHIQVFIVKMYKQEIWRKWKYSPAWIMELRIRIYMGDWTHNQLTFLSGCT